MRLSSIINEFEVARLSELDVPMPGAQPAGAAPIAGAAQATQDPQAAAKLQAQQVKQMMDRKKQIQDQIKQTQEQLVALQKELATLR